MFGSFLAFFASLFLAFSNGANDNFKGVATLFGSGTVSYKVALIWATLTTLAGSLMAFFIAQELIINFSGKGLVPDEVARLGSFTLSVAIAAGLTIFFATKLGFPISTTHGIVGALIGTGLLASPSGVNLEKLFSTFLIPLILSPLIAILGTLVFYPFISFARKTIGVTRESCICFGSKILQFVPLDSKIRARLYVPSITVGSNITCEERYTGKVWGINAKSLLDGSHFVSSGLVGFSRGLNDTPKIAAIILASSSVSTFSSIGAVAIAMALGGLIFARKIAETMSFQITKMNDGQGFSANIVTSLIVIGASRIGMPVSTTHVSCGSLFGIGMVTKKAQWNSIFKIVASWVITLPVAAILGHCCFFIIRNYY
jgi:inorganic phosphate transporter, PiT family